MRDLLKRGIAVHHSGILPIIKEVSLKSVCTLQWVWHSIVFRLLDVQLIPLVEMCVCVHFLIHLFCGHTHQVYAKSHQIFGNYL